MTARPVFALLTFLLASRAQGQIVLERTSCFGMCPAYRLEVRPDGSVMFTGHNRFVVNSGTKRLTRTTVDSLTRELMQSGLLTLADSTFRGSPGCRAWGTDSPSIVLSVTSGLQTKTAAYDLGCYGDSIPADGIALQAMLSHPPSGRVLIERLAAIVDSAVGVRDWIRIPQAYR
jgi:hypothetical protein